MSAWLHVGRLLVVLALATVATGCGGEAGDTDSATSTQAATGPAQDVNAPDDPEAAGDDTGAGAAATDSAGSQGTLDGDPLAGVWWVLSPDLPYMGLRLELSAATVDGAYGGSCISFDWRGTANPDEPFRPSLPVGLAARVESATPLRLILSGPVPMLDHDGRPNGRRGRWQIVIEGGSLSDPPSPLHGRMSLSEPQERDGIRVTLARAFRPWGS